MTSLPAQAAAAVGGRAAGLGAQEPVQFVAGYDHDDGRRRRDCRASRLLSQSGPSAKRSGLSSSSTCAADPGALPDGCRMACQRCWPRLPPLPSGWRWQSWARVSRRWRCSSSVMLAIVFVAPPVIIRARPPPSPSYRGRWQCRNCVRRLQETPQPQVGFIAKAGETVTIRMADQFVGE